MNTVHHILVRLKVDGDSACFRRPEFIDDLVTYDVMPPSVARKLLEGIYMPPHAHWRLCRLHVLKPVRNDWRDLMTTRGRKRSLILRDVSYVIEAILVAGRGVETNNLAAFHAALASDRAHPHLGLSDFRASVSALGPEEPVSSSLSGSGTIDLGWMLHDLNGPGRSRARYFRALMVNGTIYLETIEESLLVS